MVELQPIFRKAYWALVAGGFAYVSWLYAMTYPGVQRAALYMNLANPAIWQDLNDVENYGFLKTQVQPFYLKTADNETIYGWHILPLHLCREHEELLNDNWSYGPAEDYTSTVAYKLLSENPNARVVVSFHGNAAHLGSVIRPDMYRMALGVSTPESPLHVFAIDYRGYGISTGTPTEEGVITDGITLLNFLTSHPLNISPSRIVITGLSLGTAVTSAVAERFAFGAPETATIQPALKDPEPFAGIILVASFSNLPGLIESYSLKGLTPPMLSPLNSFPQAKTWIKSRIVDTWLSNARLARLTGMKPRENEEADRRHAQKAVDITIIHARNDAEIPWKEGFTNWMWATTGGDNLSSDQPQQASIVYERIDDVGRTETRVWEKEVSLASTSPAGNPKKQVKRVRWEKVGYGGHNQVGAYSVAALAILRSFEE
ncbi:Monoacylglycerol lipase ABHD12 [Talaromyces pinophilus]|nr:Monoacylglycerol lipase ABHD12 [Talaromyces pinophilus]